MPKQEEGKVSLRKEYEIRKRKKELAEGYRKVLDSIIAKLDRGEPLRDEEVRFVKTAIKEWPAIEESLVEEKEQVEELSEGNLKIYIDRLWNLKEKHGIKTKEDFDRIMNQEYYLCDYCGSWHLKGKDCLFKLIKLKEEVVEKENVS